MTVLELAVLSAGALAVEGPHVRLVATFEDGAALVDVMRERGLEGVAKRLRDPGAPFTKDAAVAGCPTRDTAGRTAAVTALSGESRPGGSHHPLT